jgi:hypothetical protein
MRYHSIANDRAVHGVPPILEKDMVLPSSSVGFRFPFAAAALVIPNGHRSQSAPPEERNEAFPTDLTIRKIKATPLLSLTSISLALYSGLCWPFQGLEGETSRLLM